jgi:hypothetical protein
MEPTIAGAPSVQMPTQFSQDRPFVSRYEDKTLNMSCPLLVSGSSLQQKKFTHIVSPRFLLMQHCNCIFANGIRRFS